MNQLKWIFFNFFVIQYVNCDNFKTINANEISRSIKIILKEIQTPLRVTAMVCWNIGI